MSIDSDTGVLTFNTAPDYETKNTYTAKVTASDGTVSSAQNITVNVTNLNDNSPSITSNAAFTIGEAETTIGSVTATDADGDTLTFTLSGTDSSSMSINSSTGALTFNTPTDYETKNSYSATVSVSDGTNTVSQNLTISISDLDGVLAFGNDIYISASGVANGGLNATVASNADGSSFVLGAPQLGEVKVFTNSSGSSWTQLGSTLSGGSGDTNFGIAADMSGDGNRVIITTKGDLNRGSSGNIVKVYEYSSGSWSQVGSDLVQPTGYEGWGTSVAIDQDGDRIVIGAPFTDVDSYPEGGGIKVYEFNNTAWVDMTSGNYVDTNVTQFFHGWVGTGYEQGGFGSDVDISLDGKVIAAVNPNYRNNLSSFTRIFVWEDNKWRMPAPYNQYTDAVVFFPRSYAYSRAVALSGSSTPGSIIFGMGGPNNNAGTDPSPPPMVRTWQFTNSNTWQSLSPDISNTSFNDSTGTVIGLDNTGTKMIVSAHRSNVGASSAGELKVYSYVSSWTQPSSNYSIYGSMSSEYCGSDAAISGNGELIIVVCEGFSDHPSNNRGRVRFFKIE
tara:strand:- start:600 stop:2276 length:1677 start_codon:yes stop_codon:yes gene_type:complete